MILNLWLSGADLFCATLLTSCGCVHIKKVQFKPSPCHSLWMSVGWKFVTLKAARSFRTDTCYLHRAGKNETSLSHKCTEAQRVEMRASLTAGGQGCLLCPLLLSDLLCRAPECERGGLDWQRQATDDFPCLEVGGHPRLVEVELCHFRDEGHQGRVSSRPRLPWFQRKPFIDRT